jgi:hypothetical protein
LRINRVGAGYFAALPSSSFSEMSPVCFRPAFDGIGEVWFDSCAKGEIIVTLVRHGRWCVFRHQRLSISTAWLAEVFFILRQGQRATLTRAALRRNSSGRTAFSWNMARQ